MHHALHLTFLLLQVFPDTRPNVRDFERFPDVKACLAAQEFARAYKNKLTEQKSLYMESDPRRTNLENAIRETDGLQVAWCKLGWIQSYARGLNSSWSPYSISGLRDQLNELRDLLGEEAYYNGEMPYPVPIWRFREVD